MSTLTRLFEEYHKGIRWAFVYTLEAHAVDEWPISSSRGDPSGMPVKIQQHRTLKERLEAARAFQTTFAIPFPVVADTIDNRFEAIFSTWPFRFYVLQGQRVVFQAQPQGCSYSLEPLVRVLEQWSP